MRGLVRLIFLATVLAAARGAPGSSSRSPSTSDFEESADFFTENTVFLDVEEELSLDERVDVSTARDVENSGERRESFAGTTLDLQDGLDIDRLDGSQQALAGSVASEKSLSAAKNSILSSENSSSSISSSSSSSSLSSSSSSVTSDVSFSPEELQERKRLLKAQVEASRRAGETQALRDLVSQKLAAVTTAGAASSSSKEASSGVASKKKTLAQQQQERRIQEQQKVAEEQLRTSTLVCEELREAQLSLSEVSQKLSAAENALDNAKVQFTTVRKESKKAASSEADERNTLQQQLSLVDILLSKTSSSDLVLEEELFAKLHAEAMSLSPISKKFEAILDLAHQSPSSSSSSLRTQLLQLRSRIEMETERVSMRVQRIQDDEKVAMTVVADRQTLVDTLATQQASMQQRLKVAQFAIEAAGIEC